MRLIDADALRERMYHDAFEMDSDMQKWESGCWIRYKMFLNAIEDAPTVEPRRKKGKWIWLSSTYDRTPCEMRYMCSECHHETILHSNEMALPWENFCPNCGADMGGNNET